VDNALEPVVDKWLASDSNTVATTLMGVLNAVDTQRHKLAEQGMWENLAYGLQELKEIKRQLDTVIQTIEKNIYDLLPEKEVFEPGIGMITKSMGSSKKWDSEVLFDAIVTQHLLQGINDKSFTELVKTLKSCLPLTSSLSWRSGSLKAAGYNPNNYCETTYTRPTIRIQRDGAHNEY